MGISRATFTTEGLAAVGGTHTLSPRAPPCARSGPAAVQGYTLLLLSYREPVPLKERDFHTHG